MNKLEQRLRQLRTLDGAITWEDFDGAPVASLPAKFRMLEIEIYTSINCPCKPFEAVQYGYEGPGLDEAQMIMFFLMSLSGATQR